MEVTSGETFNAGGVPPILDAVYKSALHDLVMFGIAVLRQHDPSLSWPHIAQLVYDAYRPLHTGAGGRPLDHAAVEGAYNKHHDNYCRDVPNLMPGGRRGLLQ